MPTPQEIEASRNTLTQNRKLKESNLTSFDFSAENITASLSNSDQPKGIAKINTFLVNKIQNLQTKVSPSLNLIASELGIKNFGSANEELPTTCPTPEQLATILQIRDAIVSQLNETSKLIQKYSGVFNKILGLIIGGMTNMGDEKENKQYEESFDEFAYKLIADRISKYEFPTVFGFPNGHIKDNRPLIIGGNVRMEVKIKTKIEFLV